MKYLKKINEAFKTLGDFSTEELQERLDWLNLEAEDIRKEMVSIRKELTKRKESEEENFAKELPDSIFDFNKDQAKWILHKNHSTTPKKHKITQDYVLQLTGFIDGGFNKHTNQIYFLLSTYKLFNEAGDAFEMKPDVLDSFNFLVKNLDKNDGYIEFGISYFHDSSLSFQKIKYYSDNNIEFYKSNYVVDEKFDSVEKLFERIVKKDLGNKDDMSW